MAFNLFTMTKFDKNTASYLYSLKLNTYTTSIKQILIDGADVCLRYACLWGGGEGEGGGVWIGAI